MGNRFARKFGAISAALGLGLCVGAQAQAGEAWVGLYVVFVARDRSYNVEFILLGFLMSLLEGLKLLGRPSLDATVSFNTRVSTHFAAVGFDWPLNVGSGFYIRPGFGLAYTTGKAVLPPANAPGLTPEEITSRVRVNHARIDFGSKFLFKPELAIGYEISPRWAIEASYVHLSNGQVFHKGKNQGLDDVGARLVWRFGAR